jgi:hypothetical protein
MPGSLTTPGRLSARVNTRPDVLPSANCTASAPGKDPFAARWLAYALPCQRFALALADHCA